MSDTKEIAKFADPYTGSKQDRERAEDVMNYIHTTLAVDRTGASRRTVLARMEPWLIDVFRAVRGET